MSAPHSRRCRGRALSRRPRCFVTVLSSQFPPMQRTARSSDHCHGNDKSRSLGIDSCHAVANLAITMVTRRQKLRPDENSAHYCMCHVTMTRVTIGKIPPMLRCQDSQSGCSFQPTNLARRQHTVDKLLRITHGRQFIRCTIRYILWYLTDVGHRNRYVYISTLYIKHLLDLYFSEAFCISCSISR